MSGPLITRRMTLQGYFAIPCQAAGKPKGQFNLVTHLATLEVSLHGMPENGTVDIDVVGSPEHGFDIVAVAPYTGVRSEVHSRSLAEVAGKPPVPVRSVTGPPTREAN